MHPAVEWVRKIVRRSGFDVTRYPPWTNTGVEESYVARMRRLEASLLIDGGANTGQFAQAMRAAGWSGRIVSFEPLPDAFQGLRANAAADPTWRVHNAALGRSAGTGSINIAGNSMSSSLLPMLDAHLNAAPESAYTGTVSVDLVRLDDALGGEMTESDRVCLKLDCQGYEREILAGAPLTLEQTVMMIIELSLVPLYEGSMVFDEAVPLLREHGYGLAAIEPVFVDPHTEELLAVDGCFLRSSGRTDD